MNIDDAVALIKHFEGFVPEPYLCPGDVWTIGYGRTEGVTQHTPPVDEPTAALWLEDHVRRIIPAMDKLIHVPLVNDQWDALISWTYNFGTGNLLASTMLRKLNRGQYDEIPREMKRWKFAGGVILPGLVRRRAAEAALFEWGTQQMAWEEAA